jgi:hypothetical protein
MWSKTSVVQSQLTQFWQIPRHRTLSYSLSTPCFAIIDPLAVKPASMPRRLGYKKKFERFSTYWYAPLRRYYPGSCTAEFGNPGGTYELPCIYWTKLTVPAALVIFCILSWKALLAYAVWTITSLGHCCISCTWIMSVVKHSVA